MQERPRVPAGLSPLGALDDYEVADGDPDVRGWPVVNAAGEQLGRVSELLVDEGAMRVRILEVQAASGDWRHVPVEEVQVDADRVVLARGAPSSGEVAATARMADEKAGGARVERREEELAVGKRTVRAGEIGIRKRIEMDHVERQVPVMHEEVTIERRPVDDHRAASEMGDDVVRIPIVEEEVVVEKHPVVKETLVVKKQAVTEDRTVEADVRKERVDVDRRNAPEDPRDRP